MHTTTNRSAGIRTGRSLAGALLLALPLALATVATPVVADDGASSNPADSKRRIRGRLIGIIPDDDSTRTIRSAGHAHDARRGGQGRYRRGAGTDITT